MPSISKSQPVKQKQVQRILQGRPRDILLEPPLESESESESVLGAANVYDDDDDMDYIEETLPEPQDDEDSENRDPEITREPEISRYPEITSLKRKNSQRSSQAKRHKQTGHSGRRITP